MEENTEQIELKSPKVQSLIGKIPRRLVIVALIVYTCVFVLLVAIVHLLGLDETLFFNFHPHMP